MPVDYSKPAGDYTGFAEQDKCVRISYKLREKHISI